MPILAYGTYSVHVVSGVSEFVQSLPVSFKFYSLTPLRYAFFAVLAFFILFRFWNRDRKYRWPRYFVLLPGIIGCIGIALTIGDYLGYFIFVPLIVITLTLLLWRWRVMRYWLIYIPATLMIGVASFMLVFSMSEERILSVTPIVFLMGCGFALPLAAMRAFLARRFGWWRLLAGILTGMILPTLMVALFFFSWSPMLIVQCLWFMLFSLIVILPFALLVIFNRWTRDVVTRSIYNPQARVM